MDWGEQGKLGMIFEEQKTECHSYLLVIVFIWLE